MMLKNNKLPPDIAQSVNSKYLSKRKDIIKVIKQTSTKLHFHSQTFYYALYCMDLIFCKDDASSMQKLSDMMLVSLACLSISAKTNENDPNVPEMKKFISVLSNVSRFRYRYSIDELVQSEIWCLGMLQYKSTYYSIYNFVVFFFAHGVFLNNFTLGKGETTEHVIPKVLEKIYVISRETLDTLLEEDVIILGEDCAVAAVVILRKAIESIFGSNKIMDVFGVIYCIEDKKEKYTRIVKIVNGVCNGKYKKKDSCGSNNGSGSGSGGNGDGKYSKPIMKDSMMDLALVNLTQGSGNVIQVNEVQNASEEGKDKEKENVIEGGNGDGNGNESSGQK